MITFNERNSIVTLEEYDLHDLVSEMLIIETTLQGRVVFQGLNIDWRDYQPTDEETEALEQAINKMIEAVNELDVLIHDIAEYTC